MTTPLAFRARMAAPVHGRFEPSAKPQAAQQKTRDEIAGLDR
jgi:hypothetical protein